MDFSAEFQTTVHLYICLHIKFSGDHVVKVEFGDFVSDLFRMEDLEQGH